MTAMVKVYSGILLIAPLVIVAFLMTGDAFSHPSLTQTQLSLAWGPYALVAIVAAVAGAVVLQSGLEDYEDD